MKTDDTITDSDVIESMLKELLKQSVIPNNKISHSFDSISQNPEISSFNDLTSKGESLEQPTEERPLKTPNTQTSRSSNIKDKFIQRDF